jgi:hypothetical protein
MGSMHGPSRRGSSRDMGARRWSRRRRWTIVWWAVAWPYYLHSLCPGSPPAWQHLLDLPLPFCSARLRLSLRNTAAKPVDLELPFSTNPFYFLNEPV